MKTENMEMPRVVLDEMEPLSQTKLHTSWICRTNDKLSDVLVPGYFDVAAGMGMRQDDHIQIVASAGKPPSEHALAVVDHVDTVGGVTVNPLVVYERATSAAKKAA